MTATLTAETAVEVAHTRSLLEQVDPVVLAIALVQYAEVRGVDDVLLTALTLAIECADLRAPRPRDDYAGGRYHRNHPLPEYSDLQKRRYPPTGNRELWIKYGPIGPPVPTARGAT